ncbi:MAG: biopolymer transporter ExbD [Myxococcota bacterium]
MGADLSSPSRRGGAKPEINITPLVDVVLVLLIIFMVVTPQMEAGVTVQLPSISNPDQGNGALEPTTVTLSKDGRLYFEKEELSREQLVEKLQALHAVKPETRIVIKADVQLAYGKVRDLFQVCQRIGFAGASLQVIDKANKQG